jgi:hypothetical protein
LRFTSHSFSLFPLQALTSSPHYFYYLLIDLGRPLITHALNHTLTHLFQPPTFSTTNQPFFNNTTSQTTTINMRYSIIAAAIIGAVAAMPAAPASYGADAAAPPSYGGESEQVYGTEVAPQMTSSAMPEATSTCTDEEENAVPYTTPAAMNAPPAYSAPAAGSSMMESVPAMVSSASSPVSPEQTMPAGSPAMSGPAGYASASMPAGSDMASSSMASPQMPAQSGPAGYASASMPAGSAMASASGSMASPDMPQQTGGYMSSPPMDTPKSPAGESAPAYGTAVVPGAAPTAAPYPVGGEQGPAGYAGPSGTAGAAMPTGTGSVGGGTQEFEGAASSLNIAGLFVSFGAVAAFFM